MKYKARHLSHYFDLPLDTLNDWVQEFNQYLSVPLKVGRGRHREYTAEDLSILDYIKSLRDQNFSYKDIHVNLQMGSRGNLPTRTAEQIEIELKLGQMGELAVASGDRRELLLQMAELEQEMTELRAENLAQERQITLLKEQYKDLLNRLQASSERTERRIDEAYRRGFTDGLSSQPPLPFRKTDKK